MLKIGVFGVGHLGKIHLKCIRLSKQYQLVGFYDPDENASSVAEEYSVKQFNSPEELIAAVDVIDIVSPTTFHFELAEQVIRAGKHVFIEKPITKTVKEAASLINLARSYGVKGQVGHVERFNPAYLAVNEMKLTPMFIEAHRLAIFNPRGTDVSVILDLMIHDLDIILSMVNSPLHSVHASGVAVVSSTPDIANARLEFENGSVANLTASRISMKQMRKIRLFQPDAYISMDFLEKKTDVVRLYGQDQELPKDEHLMELDLGTETKYIHLAQPEIFPVNAIQMELDTFAEAILNDTEPIVSLEAGARALETAELILEKISLSQSKLISKS